MLSPVALAAAIALTACSTTPVDPTKDWSPNKIQSEARDERDSGNFEKAIELYEKLEGRAAGTPLAQQAQLEKAFAQYKAGDQAQALATIDRFLRLHPASPALDYALYLKGLVTFNENLGLFGSMLQLDLAERDQKAAKESFEAMRELVTRCRLRFCERLGRVAIASCQRKHRCETGCRVESHCLPLWSYLKRPGPAINAGIPTTPAALRRLFAGDLASTSQP